jgi:TP901 family phage tail tape measure protein
MASGLIADLMIRFRADVGTAQRQVQRLNATIAQSGQGAAAAAKQQATHTRELQRAGQASQQAARSETRHVEAVGKTNAAMARRESVFQRMNRGTTLATREFGQLSKAEKAYVAQAGRTVVTVGETTRQVGGLRTGFAGLRQQMSTIPGQFNAVTSGASKTVGKLSSLAYMLSPTAGAALETGKAFGGSGAALAGAAAGLGLAGGLFLAGRAAVRFESDFAGVAKTFPGTEAQLAGVRTELRLLTREIPSTSGELSGIAESAGQLGIQAGSVTEFTETIAKLGETSNLVGEEGATQLARFANITQMPQDQFDELASVVVELGNKLASTEAEIAEFGLRIAGAGDVAGLSEAEILAVGAALSSVGINAEAGGTAISRTMIEIASAAELGGEAVDGFAQVAGMTAEQFTKQWKSDPAAALVAFVEGLGRIEEQGGSTFATLEALGITEQRQRDALLRASGAGDLLRQSLALATDEMRNADALTNEYNRRLATTESQMGLARNAVSDLAVSIGENLLPATKEGSNWLASMANALNDFIQGEDTGQWWLDWLPTGDELEQWAQDHPAPFEHWRTGIPAIDRILGDHENQVKSTTQAHRDAEKAALVAAGGTRAIGNAAGGAKGAVDEYGDALGEAAVEALELDAATQAAVTGIQGWADPMRAYTSALSEHNATLRSQAESSAESHNAAIDKQIAAIRDRASARAQDFRSERSVLGESESRQTEHFKRTTNETVRGMEAQADARVESLERQKRDTDDFYTEVDASFDVYMQSLNDQLAEQRAWHRNLNEIRKVAGDEYADMLAAQGPEQAGLVAEIADQSEKEIRRAAKAQNAIRREAMEESLRIINRNGDLQIDSAGRLADGVAQATAEKLGVMPSEVEKVWEAMRRRQIKKLDSMVGISANGAGQIVDSFGTTLDLGQVQVSKVMNQYAKALADGLNPVIAAIDGKLISFKSQARAQRVYQAVSRGGGRGPGIFATGGQVPGGMDRAGSDDVVARLTRGEWVMPVDAVARYGPGFMEAIQKGRLAADEMPGFKLGGIVDVGRKLRQQGYLVGEHPAFGGVAPVHTANSYHYRGQALDINWPGGNEGAKLDQLRGWILANVQRNLIRELIWRAPGHESHLHLAMGGGKGTYMPGGAALPAAAAKMPKVPDFPHNGIARSAHKVARYARKAAQDFADANALVAGGPVGTDTGGPSGNLQKMALQLLQGRGWAAHWGAFKTLVQKESSWNPRAQNPTSTAFGLGQFLDSTWGTVGGRKTSDPRLQLEYMMRYIDRRYGNPSKALAFHGRHNWYDQGGLLQPGTTMATNQTGQAEVIAAKGMISAEVTAALEEMALRSRRESKLQDKLDKLTAQLGKFEQGIAGREERQERKALTRELEQLRRETRNERARLEKDLRKADSKSERRQIRGDLRTLERDYRGQRQDIQARQRDEREQRRIEQMQRQVDALDEAIEAERDYVSWLQDRTGELRGAVDDEVGTLNQMLDAYDNARKAEQDARKRYDEAAVEAEKRFNERRVELQEQYQQQVSDLLDARRDELRGWMALDQMPDGSKIEDTAAAIKDLLDQLTGAGLSESSVDLMRQRGGAGGFVDTVTAQTSAMREWREGLAALRGRGVSDAVFEGFDLNSSPEMLKTVRQLVAATDEELRALNEAVAARNAEIDVRVAEEQRLRLGRLGEQLIEARQAYDADMAAAQQQFHADMAAAQQQLNEDLQAAREQLAEIGADTGRDWSQAIADGIASKLPAILEQVAKVRKAMAELQSAESALKKATGGGSGTSGVSGSTQWANVKKLFDKHGVSLSKGALPGETAGQRVDRIAREVASGQRSLSDVEKSVKRLKGLHAGGIVPARPGGFLARIGEGSTDEAVIPLPTGWQQAVGNLVTGKTAGNRTYNITVNAPGADPDDIEAAVLRAVDKLDEQYARDYQAAGIGV